MQLVNATKATEYILMCIKAGLVAMLHGDPGIGKSSIIYDIAKQFKLKVIDIRLSQLDPTDLNGFPHFSEGKASYMPMDVFPMEEDKIPEGYNGFLLFLDEFNSASIATQAASYKLTLDKAIGSKKLHSKTAIVCAGNLDSNGAITNRIGTAMQSRLVHLNLTAEVDPFIVWGSTHGIDHRILAYVHDQPKNLHNFDPKHNDVTFACPRTWEFASRILDKFTGTDLMQIFPLLSGTISEGIAREFIMYAKTVMKLADFKNIIANPLGAILNEEPSMLYAMSYKIAANTNKSNIKPVMQYIKRMPIEFQTITLQNSIRRVPELLESEPIETWMDEKGTELFS